MLIEMQEFMLIKLKSKLKIREEPKLLKLIVLKLKPEWSKNVLQFRLELSKNKLKENSKLELIKKSKRSFVLRGRLKLNQ